MRSLRRINLRVDKLSGLYLWALFIVIFGLWQPSLFLTGSTVHTIASQYSLAALIGVGLLIPLVSGTYDLSVGSTANMATVVVVWLQVDKGWAMWPAIAAAILVGVLIGVVNGFVVVKLRVGSFIATLGTATGIMAFQTIVSGANTPAPPISEAWNNLAQRTVGGFQIVVIYVFALVLVVWWILDYTPAGRYLYAIGGNREAARLTGLKVDFWVWMSLIGSATLSSIVGVLYASLIGPSLDYGSALLLPAFAAVFLGATQFTPGRFNLWGTVLAVFVLGTGVTGLELVTSVQWLNDMFNCVALLGAVSFAGWRQRVGKAKSQERESSHSEGGDDSSSIAVADGTHADRVRASPG